MTAGGPFRGRDSIHNRLLASQSISMRYGLKCFTAVEMASASTSHVSQEDWWPRNFALENILRGEGCRGESHSM